MKRLGIFFFIFYIQNIYSQDIFDKYPSHLYFNYLISNNKYELAMQEFERIKFLNWQNDTIFYKVSLLNWHNDNKDFQKRYENLILNNYPNSKFAIWINEVRNNNIKFEIIKSKDSLYQIMFLKALIFNSNWEIAEDFLVGNKVLSQTNKANAIKIIETGLKTKKRSPALGSILSAIVPGTGKLYANEIKDGAFSFLFVASSAIGLWRVVENNGWDSPWTYLLGSVSAGFYVGNIYGSFHSVKRFNKLQSKELNHAKYLYLLD